MCGYGSLAHMKAYFREQTGMTMRDWRKRTKVINKVLINKV